MKRFFSLFLTAALAGAGFVSCSDDPEDQPVVPTDVEKVSGIETNYVLGLHEYLEITPDIELSNENESISYEWSIDYETVSTERNLSFKCDELLNDVNCYFKASSSTGAKIAEFKLSVTSPYDKGLLLLSQTVNYAVDVLEESNHREFIMAGTNQLLKLPEFRDADKAHELMSFLADDKEKLPVPDEGPIKILIGPENVNDALKDTSVVVASYDIGDDMRGLIGVVGPTRMDYATVAARLTGFADGLTRLFGKQEKQELPPKEDTDT